ncbi:MAG TPA: hypothetical protein IAC57_02750 [Candidatus Scatosoma pullistercoris]|uniref:Uncharacterized protein n=1 Tax=Candidatus Scatosoma pullistercoris TaxID=2840934 RepID=A0A9D1SGC4_9FIRM|nr:hypothetical protein [Candidatus Scatosoma pullistercoris]
MTQEKLRRVVTAATVAGTLLVVGLLAVIGYQIIKVIVLNNRIKEVEKDIAAYEEEIEKGENDLNYYLSDLYLEGEAYKHHFIYPDQKVGK